MWPVEVTVFILNKQIKTQYLVPSVRPYKCSHLFYLEIKIKIKLEVTTVSFHRLQIKKQT